MELGHDETLERYTIAVVVPAYNEELLIQETLQGIPDYVTSIYVVDDGSSDRTAEQIVALNDPRIVFIRHEVNKGVGAAIITGYRLAKADQVDLIAVMGGDNQMDPEELPRLLVPVIEGDADYAKGNRLASRVYRKGMSRWRQFGNFVLTTLTKLASGYWDISDPQNGYTVISRKALSTLNLDMIYTYYGYCNDMLIKLSAAGLHTADVVMPARYGRERSSIRYGKYVRKVATDADEGVLLAAQDQVHRAAISPDYRALWCGNHRSAARRPHKRWCARGAARTPARRRAARARRRFARGGRGDPFRIWRSL